MILIRDVKIENVQPDYFQPIMNYNPGHYLAKDFNEPEKEILVTEKMIEGVRFKNTKGIDVVIGWDKHTQDYLGLPFEVFNFQKKRMESDYKENKKLRKRIRELESMTLIQFILKKIKGGRKK